MSIENLDKKLLAELSNIEARTKWISQVLRIHGLPTMSPIQVAHFNIGNGEELLHSRKVYPQADIFAFDITTPKNPAALALLRQPRITWEMQQPHGDITHIDGILTQIGSMPQRIISRHPRIVESINPDSGDICFNDWWAPTLAQWARLQKNWGEEAGQDTRMLITTYTKAEQHHMRDALRELNLRPQLWTNTFCPDNLTQTSPAGNGQVFAGPDRFVITI